MNPPGKQPHNGHQEFAGHVRDDLKAYQDGELTLLRRCKVRWHLSHCAECREESKWLARLGEDMRDLERAQPRPELRQRILASLPEAPPGRAVEMTPLRPMSGAPRSAFAGACVALLAVGAFAVPRLLEKSESAPNRDVAVAAPQNSPSVPPQPSLPKKSVASAYGSAAEKTQGPSAIDPFSPRNLDNSAERKPRRHLDDSDAINRRAEQIFQERQRARSRQEQKDWNRLLAQNPALKNVTRTRINPPIRIALAVSPGALNASREDLIVLTRKFGGSIYAPAAPANREETVSAVSPAAPTGAPLHLPDYLSGPDKQRLSAANVLLLKVPAAREKQLLRSLQEMGKVSQPPSGAADSPIALMTRQALKPLSDADKPAAVQAANPPAPSNPKKNPSYSFVLIQMHTL